MLSLSPAKLLVVLIIALIVLGPEKLPDVARQIGAMWGDVRRWRAKVESEVRSTFPDLPPTHEVVQAVRSPLSFLDRLADHHERATSVDEVAGPAGGSGASEPELASASQTNGGRPPGDGERARSEEAAAVASAASDGRSPPAGAAPDGGAAIGPGVDGARAAGPSAGSDGRPAASTDEPELVYDDPSMN